MARPRRIAKEDIVEAAKDAFWESGYEGTALSDLEERTGLNRSSLYHAFGSKRELFDEALDRYWEDVPDRLLSPLESEPSLDAIVAFFEGVKQVVLDERGGTRRGCLLVNTIAELATHDEGAAHRGAGLRDRLHHAFVRALEEAGTDDAVDAGVVRKARMLTVSTFGIWICARIDLVNAAEMCDEIGGEVESWRRLGSTIGRSPDGAPRSGDEAAPSRRRDKRLPEIVEPSDRSSKG